MRRTMHNLRRSRPLSRQSHPGTRHCSKNSDGKFLKLPITPCGACRQALLETEQHQKSPILILLYGTTHIYRLEKAADLLPLHFDSEALG